MAGRLALLTHSTLTETLASYSYSLDNVGNRRVLTESLITVQEMPAGAYLENDGLVVMEAEHFTHLVSDTTHTWLTATHQSGYTGSAYLQPLPDLDALYQTSEITASPRVDFPIHFTTPQTYTVWLRGYPANAAGDSAYVSLDEQVVSVTGFGPGDWEWANERMSESANGESGQLVVESSGLYTLSLSMRDACVACAWTGCC